MFDAGSPDDMNTDEAELMGGKRCASMSLFDSPLLIPPAPAWSDSVRELAQAQLRTHDPETLVCIYIELLKRAKSFMDFWVNNVGPTEDWPISVMGDTEEVEACLQRRVSQLGAAVDFVEESTCG